MQGTVAPLFNDKTKDHSKYLSVLSSSWIMDCCATDCSRLDIVLQSPLKLFHNGRLFNNFNFSLFASKLLRRITSLAYYYCDYEFDLNLEAISEQVSNVVCVRNDYSYSKNNKLSGVVGSGSFEGDLSGILPFMKIGAYLNVGKLSTYGMGSFKLE